MASLASLGRRARTGALVGVILMLAVSAGCRQPVVPASQEWVGKRVTLFPSVWNGEDCIRVWGSPDIESEMKVTVSLPRRRPFDKVMHKVEMKAAA